MGSKMTANMSRKKHEETGSCSVWLQWKEWGGAPFVNQREHDRLRGAMCTPMFPLEPVQVLPARRACSDPFVSIGTGIDGNHQPTHVNQCEPATPSHRTVNLCSLGVHKFTLYRDLTSRTDSASYRICRCENESESSSKTTRAPSTHSRLRGSCPATSS